MLRNLFHPIPKPRQYLISMASIVGITLLGLALHEFLGYRVVAFLLLVSVALLAMFLDILPVVLAAVLSALLWNFLFIPPRFTFSIGTTEDRWLLIMYFVIALIHGVLTYRIRIMQREMRKKEAKANAVKYYNTLLNSLSHELRTPITTIIGAADNLTNNKNLPDFTRLDLLHEINVASLRLNQQVENLLNMSRLESGVFQLKKDWVDIRELIYTTLQRLEPTVLKFRTDVFVDDNMPLVKIDFGLMEQVLHNLINNAMQHTPEGTDIIIKADYFDSNLVLEISDSGKGFPETDIHRVFEKFYRVQGSRPGGTGLGLSIVKGFVEAHQGAVSLKNLPLRGAIFSITIPTEATYINKLKNE
jgi:two-component system, OmpR family, sensor histidine kinase KdpD